MYYVAIAIALFPLTYTDGVSAQFTIAVQTLSHRVITNLWTQRAEAYGAIRGGRRGRTGTVTRISTRRRKRAGRYCIYKPGGDRGAAVGLRRCATSCPLGVKSQPRSQPSAWSVRYLFSSNLMFSRYLTRLDLQVYRFFSFSDLLSPDWKVHIIVWQREPLRVMELKCDGLIYPKV